MKKSSCGRDLVYYCGASREIWNPATARTKGIGGSEEAVIHLSRLLAERGWNVTVYNQVGPAPRTFGAVTWKPFWMWNPRDRQDVTVLWRSPEFTAFDINSDRVYLDSHDALPRGALTEERVARLTKVFVKSRFQRSYHVHLPDEKFVIVPNGIVSELFREQAQRDPFLLVNTSAPERSLSALLDCYARVKRQVPGAKLTWCYGWGTWDQDYADYPVMKTFKKEMKSRMAALGVEELGRISHGRVANLYLRAQLLAYPTEFAEIGAISVSKAMAAGAVPVTTDFAVMGEMMHRPGIFIHSPKTRYTWCKPDQFDFALEDPALREAWVCNVVSILKRGVNEQEREEMRRWARETFDWNRVADTWNDVMSQ